MASNPKNFLDRNGRYFSRISVPEHLRPFLDGKTELRKALGGDRRSAVAQHIIEIAVFRMMLDDAERQFQEAAAANATPIAPWSTQEIAFDNYSRRLAFDMECRRTDHHYANAGFDDQLVALLKRGYSGLLSDGELAVLVVDRINHYKRLGHTTATFGTFDWRTLAMEICRSEYEAIARATERDEGDFSGQPGADANLKQPVPTTPADARLHVAPLAPTTPVKSQSIHTLFDQYIASRKVLGGGAGVEKRWPPVIKDLIDFLGHEDALRVQKSDIIRWRNEKQKTLAPKTIKSVYLSCIQTVLKWAVENDLLPTNEAATVRQELPRTYQTREKGYRKAEALRILKATQEGHSLGDATKDTAARLASIRWVPWLCAFTGARVVEITQLRRQDIRWEENAMILRISPDAGTVKTGQYRDVPVHPQIMEMGFATFVEAQEGPLFYQASPGRNPLKSAQASAAKLTKWLKSKKLTIEGVAPNHGWRHHFKTYAREAKIEDRVLDAITGHASRTAGDDYGDVTLLTRINAINSLPHYHLASSV